ncbi:MAG: RNA polymerase sigma factor [Candidatus Omnitrophota bacterium]
MHSISNDLLIRASEGNIEAFEEIYKAASGFVYSTALRITKSTSDAEEITQDVFLKVYRNLKSFGFRSSFKTWLYRVTVNTALNTYKKISQELSRRVDDDIERKEDPSSEGAREAVEQKDAEKKLASLLEVLSPEQRACILLREIEGLSYWEIAGALGININTVRSRLKRARETLLAHPKSEVMQDGL